MTPGTFDFPLPIQRGDTFNGHSFEVSVDVSGVVTPVDFTGATIIIQFRTKPGATVVLEWKTSDSSITILNNKITMQPKTGTQMNVEPGTYKYDINVVLASGVTNTYVKGEMTIVDDISR